MLPRLVQLAALALFAKVLVAILAEYRWCFPANFKESSFLVGRPATFVGLYRAAFYVHLASGPPSVVLGLFLILAAQ